MKKIVCLSATLFVMAVSASNKNRPVVIAQGNKNELITTMDSLERSSVKLQEGTIRLNKSLSKIQ